MCYILCCPQYEVLISGYSPNPNKLHILNDLLRYTRDKKSQNNEEKISILRRITKHAPLLLLKGPLSIKEQK